MSVSPWDVIVIGGGPAGSCSATTLARAGRRVLLLEKERFPRFHIGESLLPYNRRLFEELGVWPALEAAGFPRKHGVQFHVGNGSKRTRFVFREGRFTREAEAFQVERAVFDELLLRHAQRSGAEVREGWTVCAVAAEPQGVRIEARDPDDRPVTVTGAFVVDASGRANLTGLQAGLREFHPRHRKLAVYGHFEGVRLDEGERGGDTVIVRGAAEWFWLIPLGPAKVSVGCVLDPEAYAGRRAAPEAVWRDLVASSAVMRERMAGARPVHPIETTADFSYTNRRLTGPRLLRVGDAAGFMDPIFSAGVYLAMVSGQWAARAIVEAFGRGDAGGRPFAAYERRVRRAMGRYWELVERFYTTPFFEVFMEPRAVLELPAAVNAVLAGELEGGWRLRWRLALFYWIVRRHARRPLVPRIWFG